DKPEMVGLRIYDLAGREVAKLIDQPLAAGYHSIVWDAGKLPSGIYLMRLETIGRATHRKVALIK
ncbi:T9SS type A sorting domain-containing protein, partial [bacterium]|nr:T9SS type A sorting domain-containing protein [bacterium]